MAPAGVPVRTCVGCRERRAKSGLVRVVVSSGGRDPRRRFGIGARPGRVPAPRSWMCRGSRAGGGACPGPANEGGRRGSRQATGRDRKDSGAVRVHELAKELGVSSKELTAALEEMGFEARTASSSVPDEAVPRLRASGGKAVPGAKPKEIREAPAKSRKPKSKPKAAEKEPQAKAAPSPLRRRPPRLPPRRPRRPNRARLARRRHRLARRASSRDPPSRRHPARSRRIRSRRRCGTCVRPGGGRSPDGAQTPRARPAQAPTDARNHAAGARGTHSQERRRGGPGHDGTRRDGDGDDVAHR